MHPRISPSTALLLTLPPLLWAANAVVGRMIHAWVPPMTLNLLPLAAAVFRRGSGLWACWQRFA